jgi:hypothetical protein
MLQSLFATHESEEYRNKAEEAFSTLSSFIHITMRYAVARRREIVEDDGDGKVVRTIIIIHSVHRHTF